MSLPKCFPVNREPVKAWYIPEKDFIVNKKYPDMVRACRANN